MQKNSDVMDMSEHDVKRVFGLVDYSSKHTMKPARRIDLESEILVYLDRKYNQATAEQAWDYIRMCTEPYWKAN